MRQHDMRQITQSNVTSSPGARSLIASFLALGGSLDRDGERWLGQRFLGAQGGVSMERSNWSERPGLWRVVFPFADQMSRMVTANLFHGNEHLRDREEHSCGPNGFQWIWRTVIMSTIGPKE